MGDLQWWIPPNYGLSLTVALLAAVCWGSWSNTAKAVGGRLNFAHYYFDFCMGTLFCAVVCWAAFGWFGICPGAVDFWKFCYAFAAGAVFGIANIFVTTGVAKVGLSIAFPIGIGTALVLGTVLCYVLKPSGKPELLFPGVALAFLGVCTNAGAYYFLDQQKARTLRCSAEEEEATSSSGAGMLGDIAICIVGGVFMGSWAPLSMKSMEEGDSGLSPYFSLVLFTIGSTFSSLSIIFGQMNNCPLVPLVDDMTTMREYCSAPASLHGWGVLGGSVWTLGTASNLVASSPQAGLGAPVAYALGQTAPLVAAFWGITWYHEFDGSPNSSKALLVIMVALFGSAIALLCMSMAS